MPGLKSLQPTRGIIADFNLEPTKGHITGKIILFADCLQTRFVDYPSPYIRTRGSLSERIMQQIDEALKIVFLWTKPFIVNNTKSNLLAVSTCKIATSCRDVTCYVSTINVNCIFKQSDFLITNG